MQNKNEDKLLVEEIKYKTKGTILIICKDWTACKKISTTYKSQRILDRTVYYHLFYDSTDSLENTRDEGSLVNSSGRHPSLFQ